VIDEIAEKCGIDPVDFRIKNGVKQGSARSFGSLQAHRLYRDLRGDHISSICSS
jgi:CO/xanthine dehydrogenase Mo-binding subunit